MSLVSGDRRPSDTSPSPRGLQVECHELVTVGEMDIRSSLQAHLPCLLITDALVTGWEAEFDHCRDVVVWRKRTTDQYSRDEGSSAGLELLPAMDYRGFCYLERQFHGCGLPQEARGHSFLGCAG